MAWPSSLLSICPIIKKHDGKLIAETGWRFRLLTLFLLYRKVIVAPQQKEVIIHRRYGWLFSRQYRLKFSEIEAVTYGYEDLLAFYSWTSSGHDGFDIFAVGLRLMGDEEWKLFNFFGEGTFTNNGLWPDWVFWDEYLLDESGTQEAESRVFVDLLCQMLNVRVVPPRP